MRKLLIALLLLIAALLAGRLWQEMPVNAQAAPVATENGDVNGDGGHDLSDAVYLLNWLFLGGPEPVPLLPEKATSGLPATGQTTCFDQQGNEIPCDSATCPGQDGFYATGCSSEGRFVDNGDGTVTDNCTGLMWQQDTADVNGDGQSDNSDRLNWCNALNYCDNLTLAGHDDWRLPDVRELHSIVDYGRNVAPYPPAIDPVFDAGLWSYWSSTPWDDNSGGNPRTVAWRVDFNRGLVSYDSVANPPHQNYVRGVRGP